MSNIQIGSLVLNAELLVYLLAGIAGVLMVRFRSRGSSDKEKVVSAASTAVILWFAIWKGSLLLFDPVRVFRNPQSLLFFDGGIKGFWMAAVVAIGYMAYHFTARIGRFQAGALIAMMISAWGSVYFLALILLSDSLVIGQYISFPISLTLLLWLQFHSRRVTLRSAAQLLSLLVIVGMIGYVVHDQTRSGLFSGSTSEQIIDEQNQAEIGIRVGQSAPNFQVVDLEGHSVSLSDYRGQTVIINFWTTWCNVCKAEMPQVEKLYQEYKDDNVVILSVNVTSQERNAREVVRYVSNRELSFTVVLDEAGDVSDRYRVSAYPTTFFLDATGVIRKQHVGAISYEKMKKAIKNIGSPVADNIQ